MTSTRNQAKLEAIEGKVDREAEELKRKSDAWNVHEKALANQNEQLRKLGVKVKERQFFSICEQMSIDMFSMFFRVTNFDMSTRGHRWLTLLIKYKELELLTSNDPYQLIPLTTYHVFSVQPPHYTVMNTYFRDVVEHDHRDMHSNSRGIANILEYMVHYLLSIAQNCSKDIGKRQITSISIIKAILAEEWLYIVFRDYLTDDMLNRAVDFRKIQLDQLTAYQLTQYIMVREPGFVNDGMGKPKLLNYARKYDPKQLTRLEIEELFKTNLWRKLKINEDMSTT